MSANVDAMVREGIRAYRAGNKPEARTLLMKAVELDEYNEQAWLWLSATVETPEEQRTCLENVLVINPNNERARNGIQMLSGKIGGNTPAPKPVSGNSSFGSVPTSLGSQPAADDEMPTSLEWDMPATETSSASTSFRPPNEPTKQEYDDWVSSLNLGGQPAPEPQGGGLTAFTMTPFTDEDNLFGVEDDEPVLPPPVSSSKPSVMASPPPPPAKKSPPPVSAPRPAPVMSPPVVDDDSDDLLDDIEGADLDDEFGDDDFGMDGDDQDPSHYFQMIPDDIKATRLPGEDEKYPAFVPIGLVLLVVLNIAAAGLLVMNLMS